MKTEEIIIKVVVNDDHAPSYHAPSEIEERVANVLEESMPVVLSFAMYRKVRDQETHDDQN